jgi:hypothetical protein
MTKLEQIGKMETLLVPESQMIGTLTWFEVAATELQKRSGAWRDILSAVKGMRHIGKTGKDSVFADRG